MEVREGVTRQTLGVVLAGGGSRRFGWEKALFPLAGRPMAAWSLLALQPHTVGQIVIANDPAVPRALGVPGYADEFPGAGPVSGLHSALIAAGKRGADGVFILACDMPLVGPELVERVLGSWPEDAPAAVPRSYGPSGFEPLCSVFSVVCLPAVEELVRSGSHSMEVVLDRVAAFRIPAEALGPREVLELAFTNVNTQAEAKKAAGVLERGPFGGVRPPVGRSGGPAS